MSNKKLFLLVMAMLTAGFIAGCGAMNYKGVSVYIEQDTKITADDGSSAQGGSYADSDSVPKHQQGSDTAVPILGELVDLTKIKGAIAVDLLRECRKAAKDHPSIQCGQLIKMPEIPAIPGIPGVPVTPPDTGEPADPPPTTDIPVPNASWTGGNLWKPVADSRGGVPVVLTKSSAPHCNNLNLFDSSGEIPVAVEYRGRTNPDRETYYLLDKKASSLPKDLIVEICTQTFKVPDPTQRYE